MVHDVINQKQGINQGLSEDKDSAIHSRWTLKLST